MTYATEIRTVHASSVSRVPIHVCGVKLSLHIETVNASGSQLGQVANALLTIELFPPFPPQSPSEAADRHLAVGVVCIML